LESEGVKIPDSIRHKYWILIILSFSSKILTTIIKINI
jgi:hypothetical protein